MLCGSRISGRKRAKFESSNMARHSDSIMKSMTRYVRPLLKRKRT